MSSSSKCGTASKTGLLNTTRMREKICNTEILNFFILKSLKFKEIKFKMIHSSKFP